MTTLLCLAPLASWASPIPTEDVPEGKQTTLGLYATASDAYAAWEAAPDAVTVVDVRAPEEFLFVGHPEMAWNIPVFLQSLEWDAEKGRFAMDPNPGFVDAVKAIAQPTDTLYLMCRSGGRSAMATDMLAEAGFTNVYSIVDGMEGDKVKDESSPDYGHRTINGWKNSGLPWTYAIDRDKMMLPAQE